MYSYKHHCSLHKIYVPYNIVVSRTKKKKNGNFMNIITNLLKVATCLNEKCVSYITYKFL